MNLESLSFGAFALGFLELNYLLYRTRYRALLLAVCNTVFLATFLPNPATGVFVACFTLLGYGAAARLAGRDRKGLYLAAVLVFFTLLFLVVKKYDVLRLFHLQALLDHPLSVIGFSYIFFKQVHLLVDSFTGQIRKLDFLTYYNYTYGFYTLLAGPIQRYNDFAAEIQADRYAEMTDRRFILEQINRVLTGFIKYSVVAAFLKGLIVPVAALADGPGNAWLLLLKFAGTGYLYFLYVYANFSGYCDIVIGIAGLSGVRLPENFVRPFAVRNQVEFWRHWHVTLSQWLNDYIFSPLCGSLLSRNPGMPLLLVGLIGYFITFFAAGMWHGNTDNFLVFGLLLGAGVSGVKLYEAVLKTALRGDRLKWYRGSSAVKAAAAFVSLSYTSFCFLFFENSPSAVFSALKTIAGRLVCR